MKQKVVTAKELAAKLKDSEGVLSQSLNSNPTLERLTQIASALEVSIANLFDTPNATIITCPHFGKTINFKAE